MSSNPTVTSSSGSWFDFSPTNFVYTLNGSTVGVGTVDVRFYNAGDGGSFAFCYFGVACTASPINDIVTYGQQYYTGSESAPTIVSGAFFYTGPVTLDVSNAITFQPNGTITIAATPEPSTFLLTFAGTALLVLRRKRGASA